MVNYLAGLRALLLADAALVARVGNRVYGLEFPRASVATNAMPLDSIVLNPSGGLDARSYVQITRPRIDVWAYGPTASDAMWTLLAAHDALKYVKNATHGSVRIYGANQISGPVNLREPETEWPLVISSWEVLVNEAAAA